MFLAVSVVIESANHIVVACDAPKQIEHGVALAAEPLKMVALLVTNADMFFARRLQYAYFGFQRRDSASSQYLAFIRRDARRAS